MLYRDNVDRDSLLRRGTDRHHRHRHRNHHHRLQVRTDVGADSACSHSRKPCRGAAQQIPCPALLYRGYNFGYIVSSSMFKLPNQENII